MLKVKSVKRIRKTVIPSPWNLMEFSSAMDSKMKGKSWKDVWKDQNIIVTNMQWLMLHGDQLPYIDLITVDEVHNIKNGNEISKLVKDIDVPYKFGCTGTLPKDVLDQWEIEGIFGPVLREVEIQKLQEQKVLAGVKLQPVMFRHPDKLNFRDYGDAVSADEKLEIAKKEFLAETSYLATHMDCNMKIARLARGLVEKRPDWNVMILFDFIEQGSQLFSQIDWKDKYYIDGEVKNELRQDIVDRMDNSGGNILVGNCKCVGTGLTVKRVNAVFLCIYGSSATKTIQAIGRGLQRKEDKLTLQVFDFFHDYKYSSAHFDKRAELYKKFYGLSAGEDYQVAVLDTDDFAAGNQV